MMIVNSNSLWLILLNLKHISLWKMNSVLKEVTSEKPPKVSLLITICCKVGNMYKSKKPRSRKHGSLTVEAACICPVFIIATIILIEIISWFSTAEKAQQTLAFRVRDRVVINTLTDNDNYVTLHKHYRIGSFPLAPGLRVPMVWQMAEERAFVGTDNLFPGDDDPIVYITPSGNVAHTDRACSYIKIRFKSYRASALINARNHSGSKYYACSRCAASVKSSDTVYVTDYGTRFHTDTHCTAINRNVMAVKYSQIKGMRLCSKCSEGVHIYE